MRPLFALVCALPFLLPSSTAAETVIDKAHGFSLTLPEGFVANDELRVAAPNIIHAFVMGDPNDDAMDVVLFIEKMKGTIGPQRLKQEDLPPGFQGWLATAKWQGFEVDAFEVPERVGEIDTVTYNVQIPLKRTAIQVRLFGPASRAPELKDRLAEILDGLHGESNWIPIFSQIASQTSPETYHTVLLVVGIFVLICGPIALYVLSRLTPKGTVLVVSAVIYVASWSFESARGREALLMTGFVRMLGFAGLILGIIDLVRKRRVAEKRLASQNESKSA
jgi:hypothetical protein